MPPQTRSASKRTTRLSVNRKKPSLPKATAVSKKPTAKAGSKPKATPKAKQPTEKPRRKRARQESAEPEAAPVVKAPKRAKAGAKLEIFMNMPIEVFIEIAKYLHPLELVLLSRVNKFFRELFMSRRASPIWRSALSNVPRLPPCPKSLCEPQYAALLFTKSCSTCGKWAPRNMDPFLLVRLCAKCRDEQAVDTSRVTDRSLVFSSPDLVPGKHHYVRWCLLDDAVAVKAKLNEFAGSADPDIGASWNRDRIEEVRERLQAAPPLREWLQARDKAREAELEIIKDKRQKEIESRLLKLGWVKEDLNAYERWRRKQWLSLVHNTKPLNDRAWEELLPYLLGHLELNREQRLKREKTFRRYDRQNRFRTWISRIRDQLDPFARVSLESMSSLPSPESPQPGPYQVLSQSFPGTYAVCGWPEFQELLDADTSADELVEKLENQRESIIASIVEWRDTLEDDLLQLLPEDTLAIDFTHTPALDMTIGTRFSPQPISDLSDGLRKLIRADTAFSTLSHSLFFYPDDFSHWDSSYENTKYHEEGSKIAKALLEFLDRPNASYLEMKALGYTFQCGRCHAPPEYMSWKGLVQHYIDQATSWRANSAPRSAREAKDITYVFTHDVDLVNTTKPLVRIVAEGDKVQPVWGSAKRCMLCIQAHLPPWYYTDYLVEHIRDMHQIDEPVEGKHY